MAAGQWRNVPSIGWFPLIAKIFRIFSTSALDRSQSREGGRFGQNDCRRETSGLAATFPIERSNSATCPAHSPATKTRGFATPNGFRYCPKSTRRYEPGAYCLAYRQQRGWKG